MKKIFATDLDGTLLKPGSKLDDSVRSAIKKLKDNDFDIIGVSGRVSSSIRYFMKELDINYYIIGNNGAIITDKHDNIFYNRSLSKENLECIFGIANKYNLNIRMYGKDTYYSSKLKQEQVNHMKISDNQYSVNFEIRDDFQQFVLDNKIDIFKTLLSTSQESFEKFYDEISKIESLYTTRSGKTNLDISSKGVNKYNALKYLIEKIYDEEVELYTIGDYYNDIEMIKNSDFGIAMGNACDELKKVANHVTDDVNNNGFEKAVDYIIKK